MPGVRRRTLLQLAPAGAAAVASGCSRSTRPSVTLRLVQVINLSGAALDIEVTAADTRETDAGRVLYGGRVGTQAGDAGAGEVVLRPTDIADPLQYDYRLSLSTGLDARIPSDVLEAAHRSSEKPAECVDLSFVVREPDTPAEVWADYAFWENCAAAPGTVTPSTTP